jgi:hypothetical protein
MKLSQLKSGVIARFTQPTNSDVRSFRTLRKVIGILGIALPWGVWLVAVTIFGQARQPSISAFYYTGGRDLFVGMLCAIGVFLVCYKGPQKIDEAVSALAGGFAMCVALLPTAPENGASPAQDTVGLWHLIFATAFFLAITVMALFLFTKGDATDRAKRRRNVVYVICGVTMAVCVGVMVIQALVFPGSKETWKAHGITFVLETIAIEAFGIAWLTKGAGGSVALSERNRLGGRRPADPSEK